jgi:hypothetical protein
LYFSFSSSFCMPFLSARIATSIIVHFFSFQFLIIIPGLLAITSVSPLDYISHTFMLTNCLGRARVPFFCCSDA